MIVRSTRGDKWGGGGERGGTAAAEDRERYDVTTDISPNRAHVNSLGGVRAAHISGVWRDPGGVGVIVAIARAKEHTPDRVVFSWHFACVELNINTVVIFMCFGLRERARVFVAIFLFPVFFVVRPELFVISLC